MTVHGTNTAMDRPCSYSREEYDGRADHDAGDLLDKGVIAAQMWRGKAFASEGLAGFDLEARTHE